jgi:uncharacterized membrane protein YphA (DoxX/SURF4 family)
MRNLPNIGRIFYGVAIAVIGFETIYNKDFHPYLLPANHSWLPGLVVLAYIFGSLLIFAGACIVVNKKTRRISLFLGSAFLLIVCFYYIPYEFVATSNYMHLGEWENAGERIRLSRRRLCYCRLFRERK